MRGNTKKLLTKDTWKDSYIDRLETELREWSLEVVKFIEELLVTALVIGSVTWLWLSCAI